MSAELEAARSLIAEGNEKKAIKALWLVEAKARLAVFLPQFESNSFARIEKNSLIQNGDGWWFIVLAVLAAGAAYRAYRSNRRSFASVVLGTIGIAVAIYYGTSHSQRRLCSLGPSTFGQNCTLATPGIGIYAAGVGGLLVLIGGWQIFRSSAPDTEVREQPRQTTVTTDPVMPQPIAERLRTLQTLLADGLITEAEYAERRAALLSEV
jgi:Short C-terminal domain